MFATLLRDRRLYATTPALLARHATPLLLRYARIVAAMMLSLMPDAYATIC